MTSTYKKTISIDANGHKVIDLMALKESNDMLSHALSSGPQTYKNSARAGLNGKQVTFFAQNQGNNGFHRENRSVSPRN